MGGKQIPPLTHSYFLYVSNDRVFADREVGAIGLLGRQVSLGCEDTAPPRLLESLSSAADPREEINKSELGWWRGWCWRSRLQQEQQSHFLQLIDASLLP